MTTIIRTTRQGFRLPLRFLTGVLFALIVTLLIFEKMMQPGLSAFRNMTLFLSSTAILSLLVGYSVYQFGWVNHSRRLHWTLLSSYILSSGLTFVLGENARSAYSTLFAGVLTYLAAFQIMLIYGTWLDQQYHLNAGQLGLVALILGLFDLTASVTVSLFTDRIGKKRSVLIGNLGALLGYLLLPWLNTTIFLTVLGIALARGSFEFAIVSHFSLLSEQVPLQRGKVMTLGAAKGGLTQWA